MLDQIDIPTDWETWNPKEKQVLFQTLQKKKQEQQRTQTKQKASTQAFFSWAVEHHRTHKGKPLTFDGLPWLQAFYENTETSLVVRKPAQRGFTEYLIAKAFNLAEQGRHGLYVMPTVLLMFTFVANRINRSILNSPYYRALIQEGEGSDSSALKHIASGGCKFVGSNSPSSFIEYPADFVIIDEYDRCDQQEIQLAYDRLKSTFENRATLRFEVSTPTFPDYGIDARYKVSDQREVIVPCPQCKEWQTVDFFTHVVEKVGGQFQLLDKEWTEESARDIFLFCPRCGIPWLNRNAIIQQGRWEKQKPGSRLAGYFPQRLLDPKAPIAGLWTTPEQTGILDAQGDASKLMVCYNSDLGLPYRPDGAGISAEDLQKATAIESYTMPLFLSYDSNAARTGSRTAGIDVGKVLHVRISENVGDRRKAIFIGTVPGFADLDALFTRFPVDCAVIDLNPERHKVKELLGQMSFLHACQFVPSTRGKGITDTKLDPATKVITVDRTMLCDRLVAFYRTQKCLLPREALAIDRGQYAKHMQCPIRIEKEEQGQRYAIWTERNSGHDDYFFAELYDILAWQIAGRLIVPTFSTPLTGFTRESIWHR